MGSTSSVEAVLAVFAVVGQRDDAALGPGLPARRRLPLAAAAAMRRHSPRAGRSRRAWAAYWHRLCARAMRRWRHRFGLLEGEAWVRSFQGCAGGERG